MDWLVTLIGAAVVLIMLRDVFHTLWHPTRHGGLSRFVMTRLWRLSMLGGRSSRTAGLAGPVGMVLVVGTWACTMAVGWSLVYWPHMPEGFSFSSRLQPSEHSGPVDALYLSLTTVATLGLGDIAPAAAWLRIVAPLEAVVGFALLTATVSWILGIYPALARRRALALRISQLRRAAHAAGQAAARPAAGRAAGSSEGPAEGPAAGPEPGPELGPEPGLVAGPAEGPAAVVPGPAVLDRLASDIARTSVDFLQYPESYYFHDGPGDTSLALTLGYAADLAERTRHFGTPEARGAAAVLATALDDLATVVDERFLHTGGPRERILAAYARDHGF
ncbi:potassium channel family protein [Streptomyces sp. MS06]|uniref:potassium channel family protein n=1 Tax=Streptomyces sp. MS06 TaxID=3385974 RepID=UPI00399FDEDD